MDDISNAKKSIYYYNSRMQPIQNCLSEDDVIEFRETLNRIYQRGQGHNRYLIAQKICILVYEWSQEDVELPRPKSQSQVLNYHRDQKGIQEEMLIRKNLDFDQERKSKFPNANLQANLETQLRINKSSVEENFKRVAGQKQQIMGQIYQNMNDRNQDQTRKRFKSLTQFREDQKNEKMNNQSNNSSYVKAQLNYKREQLVRVNTDLQKKCSKQQIKKNQIYKKFQRTSEYNEKSVTEIYQPLRYDRSQSKIQRNFNKAKEYNRIEQIIQKKKQKRQQIKSISKEYQQNRMNKQSPNFAFFQKELKDKRDELAKINAIIENEKRTYDFLLSKSVDSSFINKQLQKLSEHRKNLKTEIMMLQTDQYLLNHPKRNRQ